MRKEKVTEQETRPTIVAFPPLETAADACFGTLNAWLKSIILADVLFFWDAATLPLAVVWLTAGVLFLTVRMRLTNLRAVGHAVRIAFGAYDDQGAPGEVSHLQALSAALSTTLGVGAIAGVAVSVSLGGPGAAFWIMVAGLLGMSTKLTECTLAQMYRRDGRDGRDGRILGGPMSYLATGFGEAGWPRLGKAMAAAFSVVWVGKSHLDRRSAL